jgi:hypothetical protein
LITTPANNEALIYESSTSLWKNKTIATALGYTPISGSGATGQVAYWNGTNSQTGSNNLFWDAANSRLSISNATGTLLNLTPGSSDVAIAINNSGYIKWGTVAYIRGFSTSTLFSILNSAFTNIFNIGTSSASYVNTGTNFLIGTTTDGGQRLQVMGDAFIKGSGATSATNALQIQDSAGANIITFRNDKTIQVPVNNEFTFGSPGSGTIGALLKSQTGVGLVIQGGTGTNTSNDTFVNVFTNQINTSGTHTFFGIGGNANPTSGTGVFNLLSLNTNINQTGGANGITRGLYVNPTLTAAADWRSIEWSNSTGWGLFGAGTANNYLNGALGIGSTVLTGYSLRVSKTITGATTGIGIYQNGVSQSDVTGAAIGFRNDLNTAAGSYTVTSYVHFNAQQSSIGAGSIVGNQIGFGVSSLNVGATNNFGFYGDIPSGTGRWNLYMNGTADNYIAGKLLIGTTTVSTFALDVNGTARVSGQTTIRGSGNTTATIALFVTNSDNNALINIDNSGNFYFGQNGQQSYLSVTDALTPSLLGTKTLTNQCNVTISNNRVTTQALANGSLFVTRDGLETTTLSDVTNLLIVGHRPTQGFAPTSGGAILNAQRIAPIINQTGTANGITRGLFINPTLTAAADWRAIEVSAGVSVLAPSTTASATLRIPSGTAPTSPVNGDIWFDGTDLKMRIGGVTKTFTLV